MKFDLQKKFEERFTFIGMDPRVAGRSIRISAARFSGG